MIKNIQVDVFLKKKDFTPLEEKLIELFIINIGTFVNAFNIAKPMAMNPIEQSNADFSMEFVFQELIEREIAVKMAEDIEKRLDVMFYMAEIELVELKSMPIEQQ
ncbi:hypothetical protein NCCP2716_26990 [Sporosarcina sp. NCCP-2716]|uniref:hypothetical protein n=1 Tax=Sporosarcina sp. NCCP-2716 TaxID=2943679 RepID=UPI00203F89D4|nr:hypothetical protein [Sporosarcina sp. NCCP-2716]GKV70201.1 hypothetical protein NCCP2716_26990 [Sporosarcina sp. NCCP-2716]